MFPVSGSDKNQTEIRYLNSKSAQSQVSYYVDELILGPSFYRGRPLFTPGTKVEYCFLRGDSLFVGLSSQAVLQENGAVDIEKGVSLFKENLMKNFGGIKNIELFIDGNHILN
ncbi:hypothetical protein [uncultured Treponema sp.]|uniref:hypothetical protein n=1 Tax=uncultured Treponema sp. TaxID=162155 RepID=UPI0025F6965F|nr:hypothetical protein [uncultured Treponema sp.]